MMIWFLLVLTIINIVILDYIFLKTFKSIEKSLNITDFDEFWKEWQKKKGLMSLIKP